MNGLSSSEAKTKLAEHGLNQVVKPREVGFLSIAKEELQEPMIILLIIVGVLYTIFGKLDDALTIFSVITLLILIEVWNEYRAKKSIAALSRISAPISKVLRDNKIIEVKTEEVVPGDRVILIVGTRVPADAKLIDAHSLEVDESSLTGESMSVSKKVNDDVYAGTLVVSGEGSALVYATGLKTKLGSVSKMASQIKPPKTPLQLSMKSLAKKLSLVAISFSIGIPLLGLIRGGEPINMLLTGLALTFAVIPEELPIIITMILGLGAYKLSKEKLLIKKLKAAEVLGDATVILTDKTGTITEGVMQVVNTYPKGKDLMVLRSASAALTDLSLTPTDKAIIDKLKGRGLIDAPVLRKRDFGNGRKTKALIRMINNKPMLVVSGAPEEVLNMIKSDVKALKAELEIESSKGRRVIAIAERALNKSLVNKPFKFLERGMKLVGLISIEDSPRKGVKETIELAKKAGVRTIMVTGDHPLTAKFVAGSVGIDSKEVMIGSDLDKINDEELMAVVKRVSVFARTIPEHKYRLVNALKANGEVVAVTGDGINDSLALRGADIGVAMGIKGTDAAKEASDAVLADDNYVTISKGIFEGRKFRLNLRKGVKYYLSVKTALVMVFLLPVLLGVQLPFSPIQIIVLELFMDLAASTGFVAEPAEKIIYTKQSKGFIDKKMIRSIILSGTCLFAGVMITYFYALYQNFTLIETQSITFTAWLIGHVVLAYVSRSDDQPLYSIGLLSNKVMNLWLVGITAFIIMVNLIPSLSSQFRLTTINASQFTLALLAPLAAIIWLEIVKIFNYYRAIKQQKIIKNMIVI